MRNQNLIKSVTHGTLSGYKHYKCRCELCRMARYEYETQAREKRKIGFVLVGPKPIKHGTAGGYGYHKCRCDECSGYMQEYRRKRREQSLTRIGPPRKRFRKVQYIAVHNGPPIELYTEKKRECGTAEAYSFGCTCSLCMTQGRNEYLKEIR
ncbi:hypothetical protein F969_00631 [Acinetobacter variabilis]|uniref:Uncharacterized protein n=1 Tax=Acinetobacter variabilis TaxID=70346 RepID=N8WU26_9GAMM|nr:hypothetical protein F969_00631 [Acinetobacter variabilis]